MDFCLRRHFVRPDQPTTDPFYNKGKRQRDEEVITNFFFYYFSSVFLDSFFPMLHRGKERIQKVGKEKKRRMCAWPILYTVWLLK